MPAHAHTLGAWGAIDTMSLIYHRPYIGLRTEQVQCDESLPLLKSQRHYGKAAELYIRLH